MMALYFNVDYFLLQRSLDLNFLNYLRGNSMYNSVFKSESRKTLNIL
jgi:hypothetical protein